MQNKTKSSTVTNLVDSDNAVVQFHQGTIVLKNIAPGVEPENCLWDQRTGRANGLYCLDILARRQLQNVSCIDDIALFKQIRLKLHFGYPLHFYQKEGLAAWQHANSRSSVMLPIGSGKSYLAVKAIYTIKTQTAVVLSTIDLMNQYYDLLSETLNTIKYGVNLALFLPGLLLANSWNIKAHIRHLEGIKLLQLNDECGLQSYYRNEPLFDSSVEEAFHQQFQRKAADWNIEHESELVYRGDTIFIADFTGFRLTAINS